MSFQGQGLHLHATHGVHLSGRGDGGGRTDHYHIKIGVKIL